MSKGKPVEYDLEDSDGTVPDLHNFLLSLEICGLCSSFEITKMERR
jgi:hypothetical protein